MINTTKNQTDTKTSNKKVNDRREPFLVIDNVYKSYPNGYKALDNVNLTVAKGEFITLIGHSGCGKSTLLNMVSGFNYPSQGSVTVKGEKITKPGPDRMVVFQGYALLPWRTVFENVYIAVNAVFPNKSKVEKNAIVNEHLAMVGLTEAADKRPPQISGGMKQRVSPWQFAQKS
jgi:bicarbonate transport system ATP-binding protein